MIISKNSSPLVQAVGSAIISLLGIVLCHFLLAKGSYEFMAAFSGIVFYCIMNPLISVFNDSFIKYTLPSWGLFVALLIFLLLAARFVSGISIWSLSEYRMMLGSIAVFYIMISLMVRLIRLIWEFAESDEN